MLKCIYEMPAGVGGWDSSESGDWKVGGEDLCDHGRWDWRSGVSAVVCYGVGLRLGIGFGGGGRDQRSAVSLPDSWPVWLLLAHLLPCWRVAALLTGHTAKEAANGVCVTHFQ